MNGAGGKATGKAIEVRGLTKSYVDVQALAGIDFTVNEGELFGFLGPNGAGKTTTINILTGLAKPDGGEIRLAGIDCSRRPKAAQHLMGVVPDESNLYPELSGQDNLLFCAALYGMRKADRERRAWELLERFGLTAAAGRRSGGYSKGMKRKLAIAAGIIHSPPVLFGTTSMLAVTVTFEKRGRSFDRLLLAPVPPVLLMSAKISGAIVFGAVNAFVPLVIAAFLTDLSMIAWGPLVPAVFLIAISSTLLGLLIAVSVTEVFEAQTFSNFFRFPMLFLCGLFVPVASLPIWLRPLSYLLPLTYGADALHGSINRAWSLPAALDFGLLAAYCVALFGLCLMMIKKRWIS